MNKFLILLIVILSSKSFSQNHSFLTAEEKAYMYHVVRKSPILDTNIGRYFDYKGPIIRFPNKEENFDSIEMIIMNNPESLLIRTDEIAKSPKGIVAELTNKIALWELNKILLAKRQKSNDFDTYSSKYMKFEELLMKKLPHEAFKTIKTELVPHPSLEQLINPTLSFNDKKQLISTFHFLDLNNQISTLNAINDAVNEYVKQRSFELFNLLGAEAKIYENILIAAGDGSSTSGLLEEREKDERGRWNKGLPKAIGFFPYQLKIEHTDQKKKPEITPLRFVTIDQTTIGNNKITNIHPDVWGYNETKQTTVVIEKNGLSYHLFGSGETRFLSPDSSFSKGATFQSIINELEKKEIGKLDEMIHGKKGYDYWIKYNTDKRNETELKIEKTEKDFIDLGYTPVTTNSKAARAVKKQKRKNRRAGINQPVDYQPTTRSKKKKRGKTQQNIVDLYKDFEMYKKKIKELEIEKQVAIDLRAIYQRRLDEYKRMMGYKWAKYIEKDGFYTFEDSSTFDLYTQEFKFPAKEKQEDFEIRMLAIPTSCLSDLADEVMLHVNITDAKPNFDAKLQIELNDNFESDKWELNAQLIQQKDSLAVYQILEHILKTNDPIDVILRGEGLGKWNGIQVVDEVESKEINAYPGSTNEARQHSKMDSINKRLRKSEVFVHLNRGIILEINSFTDPVASNINISNKAVLEKMNSYKLSKNQMLSAFRTKVILNKLKDELNVLAGTYFNREEAKVIIDKLNKEIQKTKISVGATSFELYELQLTEKM